MKKLLVLALVAVFLFIAGCIQPPVRLGCCLKENVSAGCVLYNTTDYTSRDYTGATLSPCNSSDPAYNTTGYCNVTIDGKNQFVPICTQDQVVSCIYPDCAAMVCGDFVYKPRVAPGFSSTEESAGDVPAESQEPAANFYKAQCRFLGMDARLRNIMKNSKSLINVFRIGVGGSFDEFDQYRYYFPMSDQFCNVNPPLLPGDRRVDRYMNYLTADLTAYDPLASITRNCLDDTVGAFGAGSPYGFSESGATRSSTGPVLADFDYNPVVPDQSNYKFAHQVRETYWFYGMDFYAPSVYKKLDAAFYRKELSIAHVRTIYDLDGTGTTRAPFECDAGRSECYSGVCDSSFYNRGVMLESATDSTSAEIITDCNVLTDVDGLTKVVCAPTKSIVPAAPGNPPTTSYASVQVIPVYAEGQNNPQVYYSQIASDDEAFLSYWRGFNTSEFARDNIIGGVRSTVNTISGISMYTTNRSSCPDYTASACVPSAGGNISACLPLLTPLSTSGGEDEMVRCFNVTSSPYRPPAGGAVFFGKLGDAEATYGGDIIIGYAIASPAEFDQMLLVKECGLNFTQGELLTPAQIRDRNDLLTPEEAVTECTDNCNFLCSGRPAECSAWCSSGWESGSPQPCVPAPPHGSVTDTSDFVRIELSGPDDPDWDALMKTFEPYFMQRVAAIKQGGFSDGCGTSINAEDVVISSMPWVIGYDKGTVDTENSLFGHGFPPTPPGESEPVFTRLSLHISSVSAQALRERNIYDEPMANTTGTGSCDMRRTTRWTGPSFFFDRSMYYDLAVSKYIYLFKYNPATSRLGRCAVDQNTYLPVVRTYGWCQPCTTSTLAYQNVTATSGPPYMPLDTADVQGPEYKNAESICEGPLNDASCFNRHISDMDEYNGNLVDTGSPRTMPDASIMKERLGDYMKSGVMPVLDLSDASNWNLDSAYYGRTYAQYDFERLLGNMGAAIIIVDHVQGEADAAKVERIVNRSSIIRERCFGCLTAFHVDSAGITGNFVTNFNRSINSVLVGPVESASIDLITFDYPVSQHLASIGGPGTVAYEIARYGAASLQSTQKPVMVVGFNVDNNDGTLGTPENYAPLFEAIVANQDELVRSGVVGIIYSPVRAPPGDTGKGLVDIDPSNVGTKSAKFCAFQGAMQAMAATRPVALFTKTAAVESVNCTKRTSLEIAISPGADAMRCDNGVLCTLPPDDPTITPANAKCPEDTIAGDCTLCNETGMDYTCTLTYRNGTVETIGPRPMSEVGSDLYMDIIGGLAKPDKCCLGSAVSSARYSFVKKAIPIPVNRPLVFSKSGDPNADCGTGDPSEITAVSGFCGIQLPIKEYDINCSLS